NRTGQHYSRVGYSQENDIRLRGSSIDGVQVSDLQGAVWQPQRPVRAPPEPRTKL
ncbi:hypothetical protein H4S02_002323, partial [Coemansia sp. RSA 2611]